MISAVEATKQFQSEVGVDAIGAVTAETAAAAEAMGFHFVDPTLDEPAVLPSNSLEYYLIQKYGAGKTTNEYKDVSNFTVGQTYATMDEYYDVDFKLTNASTSTRIAV